MRARAIHGRSRAYDGRMDWLSQMARARLIQRAMVRLALNAILTEMEFVAKVSRRYAGDNLAGRHRAHAYRPPRGLYVATT